MIAYPQMLGKMSFEILVAVRWPLFHRKHFTPRRAITNTCLLLIIDMLISCLHFFYGYHSAMEYVPQVLSVSANEYTLEGQVCTIMLMIFTSIPCFTVLVWSSMTIITLQSLLRVPRTLSNGAIQRDPLTGATRVSYSQGTRTSSKAGETSHTNMTQSIKIHKISSSNRSQQTVVGKTHSNISLRGPRQYSRFNILTILFGIRFSVVWFGSLVVSMLIVMLIKNEKETLVNKSQYMYEYMNNTLINNTCTMPFYWNFTTSHFFGPSFTKKTWLGRFNSLKNIRLNIVFYCVCLIGIEDIIFYIAYNKQFRRANNHFIRRMFAYLCSKFKQ